MEHTEDCYYQPNGPGAGGAIEIEACAHDPENLCRCGPDTETQIPSDPCIDPSGDDPECRYCNGDNTTVCIYCKTNCSQGLVEVGGSLRCISNTWRLDLFGGTAGVCPEIGWTGSHVGTYSANGNCPPSQMNVSFVINNGCSNPDLWCGDNQVTIVTAPVTIIGRNN